jgi:RNA polymerase sigma-70 factor, ECF subfamily
MTIGAAEAMTREQVADLYARYGRTVRRRARELLGPGDAADEAAQDVFVRVFRAGGRSPLHPTPTAWLYRITTNLCLNRLRDARRRQVLVAAKQVDLAATHSTAEVRAIVASILRHVPRDLQDVAIYSLVDELTYDEIARLLGLSRRTVSYRLAAFRDLLETVCPEIRRRGLKDRKGARCSPSTRPRPHGGSRASASSAPS